MFQRIVNRNNLIVFASLVGVVAVLFRSMMTYPQRIDMIPVEFKSSAVKHFNLTNSQIKEYHKNGVLLVKNLFEKESLIQLKSQVSRVFNEHGFVSTTIGQMSALSFADEALMKLIRKQSFGHVASQLLNTSKVRMIYDSAWKLDSSLKGYKWHFDIMGFPIKPNEESVSLWIPLRAIDNDEIGGGLALSKGSHKLPINHHCRVYDHISSQISSKECNTLLNEQRWAPNLDMGDVIIFDRWMFHKTVPFLTDDDLRMAVTIRLTSEESHFHFPQTPCVFPLPQSRWAEANQLDIGTEIKFGGAYFPQVFPEIIEEEYLRPSIYPHTKFAKFQTVSYIISKAFKCSVLRTVGLKESVNILTG